MARRQDHYDAEGLLDGLEIDDDLIDTSHPAPHHEPQGWWNEDPRRHDSRFDTEPRRRADEDDRDDALEIFADDGEPDSAGDDYSLDVETMVSDSRRRSSLRRISVMVIAALVLAGAGWFGVSTALDAIAETGIEDVSDEIDVSFLAEPAQVGTENASGRFTVSGDPAWRIDASEAGLLSVYRAGVLQVTEGQVRLRQISDGEQLSSTDLTEAITTTFETTDTTGDPAVGYATDDSVVVMSRNGVWQWDYDGASKVLATGDTALLVDTEKRTVAAVVPGEAELVEVDYDPELLLSGADGQKVIQPKANTPEVHLVAFEGDSRDVIDLIAPHEEASFVRHLSVGHGLSLAQWDLRGVQLMTVHSLLDGSSLSTVADPDPDGWKVGRGTTTAITGPYAVDLSTGHFTVEADRDLTGSVFSVPFIEDSGVKTLIVDEEAFRQVDRLRGVTEQMVVIETGDSSIEVYLRGSTSVYGADLA